METEQPTPILLADYRPPAFRIESVALEFDLEPTETRVTSWLEIIRDAPSGTPLVLDGEDLTLLSVRVDGAALDQDRYTVNDRGLTIRDLPERANVEIVTTCRPAANTRLEGLYVSSNTFCTQCEAEGFRRITYFLDRPDVMAVYTVTIRADKTAAPVLLSNGNLIVEETLGDGRHRATWYDPYPKPSYLFALVAGDLAKVEDEFVTASGRTVSLRIFVEHGNEKRCDYALDALKRSMRWDEEIYGLEYDLDLFNIVAVSDFNMGAMENKSLNLFNAKYVLADPDTATDLDYALIEAIVAHEYFHNWTGNRVTCRDWFQLSLKEGLTVFRDQQFSADMRSAAVKRIEDVRQLRARQFPEDAGPLAHPVRPSSYIEINNFYTATVYEKGAEIIRMMHSVLGPKKYRAGIDLYFERHDGQAVTCDDFAAAMSDATSVDLSGLKLWYAQAGTPTVRASGSYLADQNAYELTLTQTVPKTPGQDQTEPMHIPFAVGLVGHGGGDLPLRMDGDSDGSGETTKVLTFTEARQVFRFVDVAEAPILSLNRGFTAPINLTAAHTDEDRAFLMAHDSDSFNRWESGQQYATGLLLRMVADGKVSDDAFVDAIARTLDDGGLDPALLAETLALPSEEFVADRMPVVDVEAIHQARETLRGRIATRLAPRFGELYRTNRTNEPYRPDAEGAARRSLKNRALGYLDKAPDAADRALVEAQYHEADNMTDRVAALALLTDREGPERSEALEDYHQRYAHDPLVIDKWFALQARSTREDTLSDVIRLLDHPGFALNNPNKVRALIGAFAAGNPLRFHASDGAGYRFLADQVLALNTINPQIAARLLSPLGQWRRQDETRGNLMKAELERILAAPSLSRDVYEIASKSLA
jgi:aminopeptidase N